MWDLKNKKTETGFTLIELLVSVALFSIVLTVSLGSIMTIADSNKKARSLMSVTNNLNFAVDSMVRSFKTGEVSGNFIITNAAGCDSGFLTTEIDYTQSGFGTRGVTYCFDAGTGKVTKDVGGTAVDLISDDVEIEFLEFKDSSIGDQPMLSIIIQGKVKVSEKISSEFSIQTSVSQRKLNI